MYLAASYMNYFLQQVLVDFFYCVRILGASTRWYHAFTTF